MKYKTIASFLLVTGTALSWLSADVIYGEERWEDELVGELPTTPNETDYVNTADGTARIQVSDNRPDADETTTDPSGQHGLIQGNINKHATQTEAMTLLSDRVTAVKVDFAILFKKGSYGVQQNAFELVYSALGDFSDTVVVQVFTTIDFGPESGPYEYIQDTWYSGQSVTFDESNPEITFTDTAKIRWRKGVGSNGFNSSVYLDDVVITGVAGGGGGGSGGLEVSKNGAAPENFDFTWNSTAGKLYDLVSSTDLSTNPETWPVWQGNEDIPAAQDGVNQLFDIPSGLEIGDPRRFFAIRERTP